MFLFFRIQGIEKGVQLPFVSPEWGTNVITNEESIELVRRYPDRFYWFCNVDPRNIINDPSADFTPCLQYYKSLGAKGVGEMSANLYFDDAVEQGHISQVCYNKICRENALRLAER